MTKKWTPERIWEGQTVAVLGSGPSLTAGVADALRGHRCIAVNYSHRLAPWADMLLILDRNQALWSDAESFAGTVLSGFESDDHSAMYVVVAHERVQLGSGHTVEIRNSGLAAIRLAARLGADRIILAGFDPHANGHFQGRPVGGKQLHPAVAIALRSIIGELRDAGIQIDHYDAFRSPAPVHEPLKLAKRASRRRKA